MKIVILDGYTVNPGDNPWDGLAALGELTVHDRTSPDKIVERGRDADIILVNKIPLRADTLGHLKRLRFVSVLATGYDMIDCAEAGRKGIPVANVPEYGTDSVAQHTMALLLALSNRAAEHDAAVKSGEWCNSPDFSFCVTPLMELAGKKIGIIGFGRIGQRVAEIARSFGMEILAYNHHTADRATLFPVTWMGMRDLFAEADVVTLHCPLTDTNREFVDETLIAVMKQDAYFINTSRGGLVNEAALAKALESGSIAGAALDVVSQEPISPDNPLLSARNCMITPHIAWASLDARRRLMAVTTRNVESFLHGKLINIVNSRYLVQSGKND